MPFSRPTNVLVTGAWGSLGRAAVSALVEAGHRVRCFDLRMRANRRVARRFGRDITVQWGDIRDQEQVKGAVAGQEAVIHCAAVLPPFTETHPELAEAINVGGTRTLVEALGAQGRPARIIFPSSVSIYGPSGEHQAPWGADDPIRPTDNYTRHKAACEALLRESGLRWLILRVGVSLDARQSKVSGEILRMMFEVSLESRLEFVHPDDVALAMVNALDCDEAWGRVLCIGGGEPCRIRQRDLFDCAFGAVGIGSLPEAAFGTADFYTDWLDTGESQRLLRYQTRSFEDYRRECRQAMWGLRWLISPLRPVAKWGLLRYSRPWRERSKS